MQLSTAATKRNTAGTIDAVTYTAVAAELLLQPKLHAKAAAAVTQHGDTVNTCVHTTFVVAQPTRRDTRYNNCRSLFVLRYAIAAEAAGTAMRSWAAPDMHRR